MTDSDLAAAVTALRDGGVILYPTDTVWGLGCDACNAEAVERLFRLKRRPDSKAMLLLCADLTMVEGYVERVPEKARLLLEEAKRPTTVIYPGARGVASQLIAADGTIGIRIPDHDFSRQLCRKLGSPLVSTSANFAGEPAPGLFGEIGAELRSTVDYVCQTGRDATRGVPSDIIKVNDDSSLTVIRKSED